MNDKITNLQVSLERLFARRRFGMKPGLDTVRSLVKEMNNPEDSFGVIHIAGTNGKGSTAAIIDSILRSAGFSVGLYTSPHLVRFNERIRINGEPISDKDLVSLIETVERCSHGRTDNKLLQEPTFFEFTTAMAFEGFRRAGVSIAIIETGIGGRLDATNIVKPLISVITRISREHTHCLGEDLLSIAGEKCGIIKHDRPVVCGAQDQEVKLFVKEKAEEKDAFLTYADDVIGIQKLGISLDGQKITVESTANSYGTMHFPLCGQHQLENLATSLAVIERLFDLLELPLDREFVRKGVAGVIWPGRFQTINKSPQLILDAAHNPGGVKALAATLKSCGEKKIGLVLGMCKDKDNIDFLKHLRPYVKNTWIVPLSNERGMSPEELANMARTAGLQPETGTLSEVLKSAELWALKEGRTVLITGSLFLLGDVLAMRNRQNDKTIEVIARGVCVKNGKILLCRTKGSPNTYLPGGHVEFEEQAAYSLRREIQEELGVDSQVGRFIGVVENTFLQKGERHCEINIVFSLDIPDLDSENTPVSVEDHIEFRWASLSGLSDAQIKPSVLCELLPEWVNAGSKAEKWVSAPDRGQPLTNDIRSLHD